MRTSLRAVCATACLAATMPAYAAGVDAAAVSHPALTYAVFGLVIMSTLLITWFASRSNRTAGDFYTAGGSIGPAKNGLAIAGDYLSAAAFLGASGLIALYGFDGMIYLVGFFAAFIPVLLFIAEPCRNLGRYTIGDVLVARNSFRTTKAVSAVSSVVVALAYMIPQIVGGAVIVRALVGIDYNVSVCGVGGLMLVYVACGGMKATTWVQVIKAVLLIGTSFVLVVLAWLPFGFRVPAFMDAVVHSPFVQAHVASMAAAGGLTGDELGWRFLEPGLYLNKPLELLSLGLALVLGTAAMPHILMRLFTVKDAKAARQSVMWAMLGIGVCHLSIVAIGFAAAYFVGAPLIASLDKGGNLAAPLLAQALTGGRGSVGGDLMLAFIAAVAFATIVAVVAGLTLAAASSLAHDVYVGALKSGRATDRQQVMAARVATLAVGAVAIGVSILERGQNVAQLVGLGYAVAASANLPALVLTLYWKRTTTQGVLVGIVGGTLAAIALVLVSPNMTYPAMVRAQALQQVADIDRQLTAAPPATATATANRQHLLASRGAAQAAADAIPADATSLVGLKAPLISLRNPGIISIPVGFFLVVLVSLLTRDATARKRWAELVVRRETGYGAVSAVDH